MSSGKLRRDRSGSRERSSRRERDKKNEAGVPELNEEEYDEKWEHEWEDIEEIGKGDNRFPKSYGRGQFQRYRGRVHNRGQNRFHKWDNQYRGGGSENGSISNQRSGRKSVTDLEEDGSLGMPSGVEMTNLKVKIQDGKRFAEQDEKVDFGMAAKMRYQHQHKFSRGRGSRGYQHSSHYGNRERWNQDYRHRHPGNIDLLDCREVLNRRKRRYSDTSESDLREKLLRKDSDLGDLRDVIEARDSVMDLRDIIEPPDMSMMDEFTEDIVGEIDVDDADLSVRVRHDLIEEDDDHIEELANEFDRDIHHRVGYEDRATSAERYGFLEDAEMVEDDLPQDQHCYDAGPSHARERSWSGGRRQRSRSRTRERSIDQNEDWPVIESVEELPRDEWRASRRQEIPEIRNAVMSRISPARVVSEERRQGHGRDLSRNRSRERIRSPHLRHQRERSFERIERPRQPSWERERNFGGPRGNLSHRGRGATHRVERRDFEGGGKMADRDLNRQRQFSPNRRRNPLREDEGIHIITDHGRLDRNVLKSPPPEPARRRERSLGRDRSRRRGRSISQDSRERNRTVSQERNRRMRSISAERGRIQEQQKNRSVGQGGNRNVAHERNWSTDRQGNRSLDQERDQSEDRDRNRSFERDRNRSLERDRNRSLERERNKVLDHERVRDFVRGRNRNVGQEVGRLRDRTNSRDRSPRLEREMSLGRERERSPLWGGPRTPSGSWDRPRSPSPARGRQHGIRDLSRNRTRDSKEKGSGRPKDQELRTKVQEHGRKISKQKVQDMQLNRGREVGHQAARSLEKEPNASLKIDRKREHEDNIIKDRARERHRSPEHRNLQEKTSKKPLQGMKDDFKQRFIKESEKTEKFSREDLVTRQGRDGGYDKKMVSGLKQDDSREWENIRDFQERRNANPVGLPFLDEARRLLEKANRDQHIRNQGNRGARAQPAPFLGNNRGPPSSSADHQKKGQVLDWLSQGNRPSFDPPEEERRRPSRWGSPNRREKPTEQVDSRKSTMHSLQSAGNTHPSAPNGKADDGAWQRKDLPSTGESQWNKARPDLPINPSRDSNSNRSQNKSLQTPREVIFVRGLARDIKDADIRHDISSCGLWAKDVRIVHDNESGLSRGLAFITFNSVEEATRWMEVRKGVLNLRHNNHAPMDYSNPISRDWECIRCHSTNFKHRSVCFQCNRGKEDCLDGWEETCPYPTNALLLRGLNPTTSTADIVKALKSRMIAQARLDGVKMGVDMKGRPRTVCFVQLTSVVDSMSLHKSLINDPLHIDNSQVIVAYCQLDKLPVMEPLGNAMRPSVPMLSSTLPPAISLTLQSTLATSNIPVVSRTTAPSLPSIKPAALAVSSAEIRAMLEGHYSEQDIPTLAQYCASAYAKNPQEQAAYVRYYTKLYKEKLSKNQSGGK